MFWSVCIVLVAVVVGSKSGSKEDAIKAGKYINSRSEAEEGDGDGNCIEDRWVRLIDTIWRMFFSYSSL